MSYSWSDCPDKVKEQGLKVVSVSQSSLQDKLIGVYLHGSLAMGCFNPSKSDLDLLLVVSHSLTDQEKLNLAQACLSISKMPAPLEISIMTEYQVTNWKHPSPFEFHFSEEWEDKFAQAIKSNSIASLNFSQLDGDLAAHITIVRERGLTLSGKPATQVFKEIPTADYIAALKTDYQWGKEKLNDKPVYFILNACRIHAFLAEKQVLSKAEGGDWALNTYPAKYHSLIQSALDAYASEDKSTLNDENLADFISIADSVIQSNSH